MISNNARTPREVRLGIFNVVNVELMFAPSLARAITNVARAMKVDRRKVRELYVAEVEHQIVKADACSGSLLRPAREREVEPIFTAIGDLLYDPNADTLEVLR